MNRKQMLRQLHMITAWDMLIVGGGATGLGAALDAASRGYTTLLLEQHDFGKGTSSRSTKLVHGGVRYLAQGNFKLVTEALRERGYLLKNAPHLTRRLAFVVPVYSWWSKWYYGIGLQAYDWLSGKKSLGKTRWLSAAETQAHLPGIATDRLKGGILYYDGQFDDTRLAIDIAATAAAHGATLLNYCKVIGFTKQEGRITGVVAEDMLTQEQFVLTAKVVVNATGVFADEVMQLDTPGAQRMVAPSQGTHLVVEPHFFPGTHALLIPRTSDGRVLFAVPWHGYVVLGTTDTPVETIALEPKPLEEEIQFILQNANRYLAQPILRQQIKSVFAGLRPLVKAPGDQQTALLSRDHSIWSASSGLITVTGGKWTTYRKMAEDVVTRAAAQAMLPARPCVTKQLPIAPTTKERPRGEQLQQQEYPYTPADIVHFVMEEMAMTVEDILARRTRLLFLDARAAMEAAPGIATLMAGLLQKEPAWAKEQVNAFRTLASQYLA